MIIPTITPELFYHAVVNGCHQLIQAREQMNAINVFPVADGDTGDNMASAAQAIIHMGKQYPDFTATAQSIADASVMGAHGNSGMIFSQFFNGIAGNIPIERSLTTMSFAHLVEKATHLVRKSIANPVEGTILTVMDSWSNALLLNAEQSTCFVKLFDNSIGSLKQSLEDTEGMLNVLKKAHVVDAGALGFTQFVIGFTDLICHRRDEVSHIPNAAPFEVHQHHSEVFDSPPKQRYCTEAVICQDSLDEVALQEMLSKYGDSVVLSANPRLCRFHVHCDEPWLLFDALQSVGQIKYPKVEDMQRQYEQIHQPKASIALVMDSSANVPLSFADKHQIHLIPVNVYLDGHDLLDYYCVDNDNFYHQLSQTKQYPQTSFPSPALIKQKLNQLHEHYEQVIVLTVAQALSGTHDAIVQAASGLDNVHVIDSKMVSNGLGMMVCEVAKWIEASDPLEAMIQRARHLSEHMQMMVMINQFDSLIRSGRVSKLKGKVAQWSGAKPIISLDEQGKGIIEDKAFSEHKALTKMIQKVQAQAKNNPIVRYTIIHAGAEDKAHSFAELTKEAFAMKPDFIEPASLAIGLHAGQGAIGLCVQYENPL